MPLGETSFEQKGVVSGIDAEFDSSSTRLGREANLLADTGRGVANRAKELMQHDQLRELAVVLTQRVRENASIDWTIKESVKAKLKVIVKRTLRQFGYPPDMQLLATETVLKQAEMIANELSGR